MIMTLRLHKSVSLTHGKAVPENWNVRGKKKLGLNPVLHTQGDFIPQKLGMYVPKVHL